MEIFNPDIHNFEDLWRSKDCIFLNNPNQKDKRYSLSNFLSRKKNSELILQNGFVFFQTSGSEGTPAWVALNRDALECSACAVNKHLMASNKDSWLLALPYYHVGGFSVLLRAYLCKSTIHFYNKKWDVIEFTNKCLTSKTTLVSLVPTQIYDIVQKKQRAPDTLRAVVVGGGHLDSIVANSAWELGWPVIPSYGMTEAASQIATLDLPASRMKPHDFESLTVLPHWSCFTDSEGRLIIKGDALASGFIKYNAADSDWYWQQIDSQSGYFTRDRVELSEANGKTYLKFLGRDSSWIKILGELINLEGLRKQLDAILMAEEVAGTTALVAVADKRSQQKLEIVTELDPRLAAKILEKYNSGQPSITKCNSLRFVTQLPKSSLGKIKYFDLM